MRVKIGKKILIAKERSRDEFLVLLAELSKGRTEKLLLDIYGELCAAAKEEEERGRR